MRQSMKYLSRAAALSGYALLLYVFGVVWAVIPAHALVSTTGLARVISPSAANALSVASRSLTSNAVGSAIASAAGPQSVAVRVLAGGAGWPAIGVIAGLTLLQILYNQQQVASIQSATAHPGIPSVNGIEIPGELKTCVNTQNCNTSFYDQVIGKPYLASPPAPNNVSCDSTPFGSGGWIGPYGIAGIPGCFFYHYKNHPSDTATPGASAAASPTEVAAYVGGLPDSDPNSIPSNTTGVGTTSQPDPAATVVNVPVSSAGVQTTVVPASTVTPNDVVVNPNAVPDPGATQTQTGTQTTSTQSTTTTTTTTNPDGSTTTVTTGTQQDDAPIVACSAGNHDQRTFGTILQEHIDRWQGSGLLSALNVLKSLTWPTALPVYQLNSNLMGNFTLDFSAWAGVLVALRSIIIALASFVAYRIVFVGSK